MTHEVIEEMGSYRECKDGYALETTWGTSAIPNTATQTYLFGLVGFETSEHPSPTTTINYPPTAVNTQEVAAGEPWKGPEDLTGMYPVGVQNGILLWAVMGKSSTAGADPYTHTITKADATAGVLGLLPSFTLHHERTGTASDWASHYLGCKVARLLLHCSAARSFLIARVDWMAKSAEKAAFTMTNDPVLPPTASASPYLFGNMTRTIYTNVSPTSPETIDGLLEMELDINPVLSQLKTASWSAGVYDRSPTVFLEGERKLYELRLKYSPNTSTLWEELLATSNLKDIVFKWTRSANDYIEITCADCMIRDHTQNTPSEDDTTIVDTVLIEPRSVTIEVKDSIAGGFYGE